MSCKICSRLKETGKLFLESDWLYNHCGEKFNGALTLRLYLINDADGSSLRGTLEGTESMFRVPILTTEIAITHCPFCGGELNGYS